MSNWQSKIIKKAMAFIGLRMGTILTALSVLMLAGCEKPDFGEEVSAEAPEGTVTLKVADFERFDDESPTREVVDFSSLCSRLNFVVFKDGEKVKGISQKKEDAKFGEVSVTLDEGTYQVMILGHSCKANPSQSHPEKVQFTNTGTGYTDTFYYYGDLQVGGDGSQELRVVMKRAVAAFRLVITDARPDKVKQIRLYYTGGSGTLNVVTGYGSVNSKQYILYDVSEETGGLTLTAYTFLHDEAGEINVLVSAYNGNGDVLFERSFAEVPMQRNTITEYSGSFFNGSSPAPDPGNPDPSDEPVVVDPDPAGSHEGTFSSFLIDPEWAAINRYSF